MVVHKKKLRKMYSSQNAKLCIIKNSSIWKTISTSRWLSNWLFTISSIWKKLVDKKNIHPRTFQMKRKNITYKFTVARQKTTNHFFHIFQSHIRRTQQNHHFPPNSHWTITAALPRINHIRRYEKNITHDDYQLSTKPIQRKRLEIMKMTVSWNRTEGDFDEESLFEDIVCYILYLIMGVIWYM